MDVFILIAFLFLLLVLAGGYVSAQHAIIEPVVDWMYPPAPEPPLADAGTPAETPHERRRQESRERRDAEREEQRKEDQRLDKALRRMERQHAAEDARWERERERFWREMERMELNSGQWDRNRWAAFHKEWGTEPLSPDAASDQSTGPRRSGSGASASASRNASR